MSEAKNIPKFDAVRVAKAVTQREDKDIKKTSQRLVAEIDEIEVACIIAEACIGVRRPEGMPAAQALAEINRDMLKINPQYDGDFERAARRVMLYLKNQIDRGQVVS